MSQSSSFDATIHVGYTPYRRVSAHSAHNGTQQHNGIEDYIDATPYPEIPTAPSYRDSSEQVHIVSYPIAEPPVITTQPVSRINYPQGLSECPRGLELLASTDQVSIYQKINSESNGLIRINNEFSIKNSSEEKIYTVLENASCCSPDCTTCCFYEMKIFDLFENEVIDLHYPLTCNCLCWKQSVEISISSESIPNYVGKVQEIFSLAYPKFGLYNESEIVVCKSSAEKFKTRRKSEKLLVRLFVFQITQPI